MSDDGTADFVNVSVAEFNALRKEIGDRSSAQNTLVNLNLTAVAAVVGLVATHRAGDSLLLLTTVISSALGLLFADHARTIRNLGRYIKDDLRPALRKALGRDALAWEERSGQYRKGELTTLTYRIPLFLIFVGPPTAGLTITALHDPRFSHFDLQLWLYWFGGLFLTAYMAIVFANIQFSAHQHKSFARRPDPTQTNAQS